MKESTTGRTAKKEGEREREERWDRQNTNSKMVGLNLIIPIITEINGLNAPTKRQLAHHT